METGVSGHNHRAARLVDRASSREHESATIRHHPTKADSLASNPTVAAHELLLKPRLKFVI